MILHKTDCNSFLDHRKNYLRLLNRAYGVNFEDLAHYKQENNFKRMILNSLTINDVQAAIRRSEAIMQRNREKGYKMQNYEGYNFYRENPSLSIWESVKRILSDCQLI
ncbi:hypothetical protein [Holdemania massiliensis]|uniref:hypothetical protein n=1 Tax=Holdemania massiliensis TaxID=1468449 RepID=UPI003D2FFD02